MPLGAGPDRVGFRYARQGNSGPSTLSVSGLANVHIALRSHSPHTDRRGISLWVACRFNDTDPSLLLGLGQARPVHLGIGFSQARRFMMSPAYMIAHDSYERCFKVPDFVANLYGKPLCRDPAVTALFAQAEFPKQHQLLQHGIGLSLTYAKRADDELLGLVAARHSSAGIDISRGMYPACDTTVSEAWQEALCSGVEFTKRRYNG